MPIEDILVKICKFKEEVHNNLKMILKEDYLNNKFNKHWIKQEEIQNSKKINYKFKNQNNKTNKFKININF